MKIEIQADQIFDIKQQAEKQPDELKERINTGTGTDKLDTAGEAALPWNQWQLSRGMGGRLRLESVATLVWNTHAGERSNGVTNEARDNVFDYIGRLHDYRKRIRGAAQDLKLSSCKHPRFSTCLQTEIIAHSA